MADGLISDLETTWSDATNLRATDGDVAATGVDTLHMVPGVGAVMDGLGIEKGKDIKSDVDNWEYNNDLTPPSAQSDGPNLGNEIGAGIGGALGLLGGLACPVLAPATAADGMAAGSRLGGWIGEEL